MKVLFISYCYDTYWRQLYRAHYELRNMPYSTQSEAVIKDHFMFYGVYPYYLSSLGYECEEFFYNIEPLQQTWSKENGIEWIGSSYIQRNTLEKLRQFKPDIVFITGTEFGISWLSAARKACPSIRLFVRWCAISVPVASLRGYDLILTSTRGLEHKMRDGGLNVERLPFAFDPRILDEIKNRGEKNIPLSFIGQINFSKGFHLNRAQIISRLIDEDLITPFIQRPISLKYELYLRTIRRARLMTSHFGLTAAAVASWPVIGRHLATDDYVDLSIARKIARKTQGPRYGLEMYRALARSLATFNIHIDAAGDYVGNVRMYEATGVGTCLLTDWKKDLKEFFEIDSETVAYSCADEAVEKARWLAQNPRECMAIGDAAQKRVLREHTYEHRALCLHKIFCDHLK